MRQVTTGIPSGLEAQRHLGPEWSDWLDRLPRLREELVEEWHLAPDGDPTHGGDRGRGGRR